MSIKHTLMSLSNVILERDIKEAKNESKEMETLY